jgi:hypothetical protein
VLAITCIAGFFVGGPVGGVICVTGSLLGAYLTVDEVKSDYQQRADHAWKMWELSHKYLRVPRASGRHKKEYHQCAMTYHPDKWPTDLPDEDKAPYMETWTDCQFAVQYIEGFSRKYGLVKDKEHFYEQFAGFWRHLFSDEKPKQEL